jgi:hypothetical protein
MSEDDSRVHRIAWSHLVAIGVPIGGLRFGRVRESGGKLKWRPCVVDYGGGWAWSSGGGQSGTKGVDVWKACESVSGVRSRYDAYIVHTA